MDGEGTKQCHTCRGLFPASFFTGRQPGREYATCLKCQTRFQAWYDAKRQRGEPRLRHDRVQDRLSRMVCLNCPRPVEDCQGQLDASCMVHYWTDVHSTIVVDASTTIKEQRLCPI